MHRHRMRAGKQHRAVLGRFPEAIVTGLELSWTLSKARERLGGLTFEEQT